MIDPVCREIIEKLGIQLFVETGTDMGETVAEAAKWFAEIDSEFDFVSNCLPWAPRFPTTYLYVGAQTIAGFVARG